MPQVRVRFAPSPTGFVHLGSLRTALYNFLFARHNNGKFILRIEDTDQSRYVEGAVENLIEVLKWAGLDPDEGPGKDGGFGPYFQSERLSIYKEHVQKLIQSGDAYPCFCSTERLEEMRNEQTSRGEDAKYDGHCRQISHDEAQARMEKEEYVIRMKVPANEEIVIDDQIRGSVSFQSEVLDDQVLIKSDGYPTYHLANVVDDHLMEISHVIRGEEWLPSTPKHVLLYKFFDWQPPQFAHLPLLLNKDRSKLSKRQGDVAVEDYQKKGILSQALVNYVALLGWNKGDDQEIFSLDELCEHFTLDRVNKSGAVFDIEKLVWMNGQYIRNLPDAKYLELTLDWLDKSGISKGNAETNKQILLAVRNHLSQISDLNEATEVFFNEKLRFTPEAEELIKQANSLNIFRLMLNKIQGVAELTLDNFKEIMKEVQTESGAKGKELWMPVRAGITGQTSGPELPVVLSVIGKERVLGFLKQSIQIAEQG